MATEKQLEYIDILSSYDSTRVEDEKDIKCFLERKNADELSDLSKSEASDLIQKLLERPVLYEFVCGKKAELHKRRANKFDLFGPLEACIHACPEDRDPNHCELYATHHRD